MSVAVLLSTWDKDAKLWPILNHSIKKYWSNCPYKIYSTTNFLDCPIGETIKCGEDKGWADMMLRTLPKIKEDTIIFLISDYWLSSNVDQEKLNRIVKLVDTKEVEYVRLVPSRGAIQPYNEDLNYFNSNFQYKTSLGPSVWNKEFFLSLILPEESIWQFEMTSANRVHYLKKNLCVKKVVYPYVCEYLGSSWKNEPMEKGNLTEDAYIYLKQENLEIEE